MKIAYVITGLGIGGAERVVVSLADSFAADGHEILLIYMIEPKLMMPHNPNVVVSGLGLKGWKNSFSSLIRLVRCLKKFRPDIVHANMLHAILFSRLARIFCSIPRLICTSHSNNDGSRLRAFFYRVTDVFSDITTNVSRSAVDEFVKRKAVPKNKILNVYNGIATDKFLFSESSRVKIRSQLSISDTETLLLAVGRLDVPKDYPNLIEAFGMLLSQRSDVKLVIAGDGPLREELIALVDSKFLSKNVMLIGNRSDVSDLMSACDIFLLSSAWEGFGLVVGEAMSCERIVVATDCGGTAEIIGDAGFLVPPKNSYELYEGICSALSMTYLNQEKMKLAARARIIENFSFSSAKKTWERIYFSKLF